jgi:putative transposase
VRTLCRLLGVSRSGFYAWLARPASARAVADAVLTEQVRQVHAANREVYGAPRIHAELADVGVRVARKRVARLMRAAGLQGAHRRKRPYGLTRQVPGAEVAPDRVDRKFVAAGPHQQGVPPACGGGVADVTYVPTTQGWLYLACVTDVFSRMVIGWSMASRRKTDLVVDAVTMAVHRRGGRVPGVIHHSDRGGEYSSGALERELRRHGALARMGSVADCVDNALADSLVATLECELFDRQPAGRFTSHREAKLAIFEYLEAFYNTRRRHSALGQVSPAAFEAAHTVTAAA